MEGESPMNDYSIYASTPAETLGDEPSEQVAIPVDGYGDIDYLILTRVVKDGDSVLLTGVSQISGDSETYILPWDKEVDLWTVTD